MKSIIEYINESQNSPTTVRELAKIIKDECSKKGWECDLNHIDVSKMTRLDNLFTMINGLSKFNGNISNWDVSNVTNMNSMFGNSEFTGEHGDISNWDVSNVKEMARMFAASKFNGDISNWDVSNVEDMRYMFQNSKLDGKEPSWFKG